MSYVDETIDETEELEDEIEETPKEDYSDWDVATLDDLNILRTPKAEKEIVIPIDPVNKKIIKLFIRELTVDEQLAMLEIFFAFDQKTGEAKMKFKDFYREAFIRTVVRSQPAGITWKKFKYYNKKALDILMKHLPNPFELTERGPSGISETEQKN